MSDGLRFVQIQSIGDIDIYQVAGDPSGTLRARIGSLAIPNDGTKFIWKNTDGQTGWAKTVAATVAIANEWFVDSSAVADPETRTFPSIEDALDDAHSVLPAGLPIVLRLREGQEHLWLMDTEGTGATSTRDVSMYSHGSTAQGTAAQLRAINTLAAGASAFRLILENLTVGNAAAASNMNFDGPREVQMKGCRMIGGVNSTLDRTAGIIQMLLQECDAMLADVLVASNSNPWRVLVGGASAFAATVVHERCRIEYGTQQTGGSSGPAVNVFAGTGDFVCEYSNCTLRQVGGLNGDASALGPWTAGAATLKLLLRNTSLSMRGTSISGVVDESGGTIEATYDGFDISVEANDGVSANWIQWGTRTDGSGLGTPVPNRVTILKSQSNDGSILSLPPDAPLDTVAVDPGTRTPTWRMLHTGAETHWISADGATMWGQSTTSGQININMTLFHATNTPKTFLPLDLTTDAVYRVTGHVSASGFSGGAAVGSAFQLEALVDVNAGTVAITAQTTITHLDTVTTTGVDLVADNGNGGFNVQVDHGAHADPLDWFATLHVQLAENSP